jgi:integral membrane sensor domain MASE1
MRYKPRDVAIGGGVALSYLAAAKIGFGFALVAEQVTTVWAPTGIAIATLLLGGQRFWPALWAGAFLANATTAAPRRHQPSDAALSGSGSGPRPLDRQAPGRSARRHRRG